VVEWKKPEFHDEKKEGRKPVIHEKGRGDTERSGLTERGGTQGIERNYFSKSIMERSFVKEILTKSGGQGANKSGEKKTTDVPRESSQEAERRQRPRGRNRKAAQKHEPKRDLFIIGAQSLHLRARRTPTAARPFCSKKGETAVRLSAIRLKKTRKNRKGSQTIKRMAKRHWRRSGGSATR